MCEVSLLFSNLMHKHHGVSFPLMIEAERTAIVFIPPSSTYHLLMIIILSIFEVIPNVLYDPTTQTLPDNHPPTFGRPSLSNCPTYSNPIISRLNINTTPALI
jgi:hypothetical protein